MSPRTLSKSFPRFDAGIATVVAAVWFLSTTPTVLSFLLSGSSFSSRSLLEVKPSLSFLSSTTVTTREATDTTSVQTEDSLPSSSNWLDKGLLLSSFTDGLKSNSSAVEWLMNALTETLWQEEQGRVEFAVEKSNVASPCNGPDPILLKELEDTDRVVEGMTRDTGDWKVKLELLCRAKKNRMGNNESGDSSPSPIDLRVLYIPTAMYALRPQSTSTPGKQRGRNRADGKKRRTEILHLLAGQLEEFIDRSATSSKDALFTVRTVTMDFDDASVKQPEEIVVGQERASNNDARFPETGKEAIREWNPHLIYVQGGNTFWLHHCMEKGDWTKDLTDACCHNTSDDAFSAVYCGVSAGAILAGESMDTACWKEWDDPSVVPGKETYDDWADVCGLNAAGRTSVFPHMTDQWQELADRRTEKVLERTGSGSEDSSEPAPSVRFIRDNQAYIVDGKRQSIAEL